ncbi:hypothetical protein C7401_102299 [Paraburkholderia unamae]|nr:hypothetical protein [Paraburkholderia unamae]RAR66874.1 hypothetical protein C7401_102299 [Paraburkholderia unamae]
MNDRKSKPKKASRSKHTRRQTNRGQRYARQERLRDVQTGEIEVLS